MLALFGVQQVPCGCAAPETVATISQQSPTTPANDNVTLSSPGGGMTRSPSFGGAAICAPVLVYSGSQAYVRPYGTLQLRSGCGVLLTRGVPLELCQWFANVPDGLISGERIAGTKTSFGWQTRLIQYLAGNVAIYWGDRTVEGWNRRTLTPKISLATSKTPVARSG